MDGTWVRERWGDYGTSNFLDRLRAVGSRWNLRLLECTCHTLYQASARSYLGRKLRLRKTIGDESQDWTYGKEACRKLYGHKGICSCQRWHGTRQKDEQLEVRLNLFHRLNCGWQNCRHRSCQESCPLCSGTWRKVSFHCRLVSWHSHGSPKVCCWQNLVFWINLHRTRLRTCAREPRWIVYRTLSAKASWIQHG